MESQAHTLSDGVPGTVSCYNKQKHVVNELMAVVVADSNDDTGHHLTAFEINLHPVRIVSCALLETLRLCDFSIS